MQTRAIQNPDLFDLDTSRAPVVVHNQYSGAVDIYHSTRARENTAARSPRAKPLVHRHGYRQHPQERFPLTRYLPDSCDRSLP